MRGSGAAVPAAAAAPPPPLPRGAPAPFPVSVPPHGSRFPELQLPASRGRSGGRPPAAALRVAACLACWRRLPCRRLPPPRHSAYARRPLLAARTRCRHRLSRRRERGRKDTLQSQKTERRSGALVEECQEILFGLATEVPTAATSPHQPHTQRHQPLLCKATASCSGVVTWAGQWRRTTESPTTLAFVWLVLPLLQACPDRLPGGGRGRGGPRGKDAAQTSVSTEERGLGLHLVSGGSGQGLRACEMVPPPGPLAAGDLYPCRLCFLFGVLA
nr:PREDICTED: uncharacterized protein LOC109444953 [Rhinolophus sinicus]